jgi:hypothetical protein
MSLVCYWTTVCTVDIFACDALDWSGQSVVRLDFHSAMLSLAIYHRKQGGTLIDMKVLSFAGAGEGLFTVACRGASWNVVMSCLEADQPQCIGLPI